MKIIIILLMLLVSGCVPRYIRTYEFNSEAPRDKIREVIRSVAAENKYTFIDEQYNISGYEMVLKFIKPIVDGNQQISAGAYTEPSKTDRKVSLVLYTNKIVANKSLLDSDFQKMKDALSILAK